MLTHLVRNAIAHGIELPEERTKKGKLEVGRIIIRSYVQGNELFLEIEDDGRGLEFEKIKQKAIEKGLGNLKPEEVIFVPGFSTKDKADETAGRGIGLDVVKTLQQHEAEMSKLFQQQAKEQNLSSISQSRPSW